MKKLQPGDRILIICDATDGKPATKKDLKSNPQGVDRTTINIISALTKKGYKVKLIHPYLPGILRFKLPMYPELELAVNPFGHIRPVITSFKPNAIFIMTAEAPLGLHAMYLCKQMPKEGKTPPLPYTTQFHTNLDQYAALYINRMTGGALSLEPSWFHPVMNYVYHDAEIVLVPTESMAKKMNAIGIKKTKVWPRGVDSSLFHLPEDNEKNPYEQYDWYQKKKLPILLYYGRVAEEKNIDTFIKEKPFYKYHRVIIGDGPYRSTLEKLTAGRKDVYFLGKKFGDELAQLVRFADVHIFPSLTDTFGNTTVEAGISGVPTIAYHAPGPKEIIKSGINGVLVKKNEPLLTEVERVMKFNKVVCSEYVKKTFSLDAAADILLSSLSYIKW